MSQFLRRVWYLIRRQRHERALAEEIAFHRDMARDALTERGSPNDEAQRSARRQLGNVTLAKEEARAVWLWPWWDRTWRDIWYAFRGFHRQPGFALIALVTLSLGIGGATALFAIVHAVLLKPLPYGHPDRLVEIAEAHPTRGEMAVRAGEFADWRHSLHTVEDTTGFFWFDATFTGGSQPETVVGEHVLDDFFEVLGVSAELGRTFTADDYRADAAHLVIVSDAVWKRRFGADPSIIGHSISVDQVPSIVVGVMPPTFWRPFDVQVWSPMQLTDAQWQDRRAHRLITLGVLKKGATIDQVRVELADVYRSLARTYVDDEDWSAHVSLYRDVLVGPSGALLRLLFAAGLVMLVIACLSVTGLTVARATSRDRDFAIRRALGAHAGQVMSLMLVEAVWLTAAATALGLWMAARVLPWLTTITHLAFPAVGIAPIIDRAAVLFTVSAGAFALIVCGVVPALLCRGAHTRGLLSVREAAGVPRRRARSLLVIIEVAGAVALVTVAGLMAESFVRLAHVGLGFDASHVIAATLRLPRGRYASDDELRAFAQQAIALRSVPGIATVAIADHLPGAEFSGNLTFSVPGHIASYDAFSAHFVDVSPTFFSALGMPLIAGRAFSDADDANTPPVMMVNDVLARRLWSDQDPIGRDLHVPGLGHDVRVVGVVPDVRMGPLQRSGENVVYFPFAQVPGTDVAVIARTAGDPRAVEASMAAAMHALDPQLPMPPIRPLADSLADTRALPRAETWWFVSFGGFALLLAALGVYGLLAFVVGRRTHEIGVRMALGANGRAIVTLVLREVCALGVLGVAAATAAAVAAGRFLQHVLFQTNASNPVMLVASTIVLAIVMGLAAYVPTYRAVHVDPTTALRSE